jgi:hypothetical protein
MALKINLKETLGYEESLNLSIFFFKIAGGPRADDPCPKISVPRPCSVDSSMNSELEKDLEEFN